MSDERKPSPGNLNSSRKQALRIGTASNGFPASPPYNDQAGTPADVAGGNYECNVDGPAAPAAPVNPSPFKVG